MSRTRLLVRRVHLWLGASLGLLVVLLGLTGAALVFYLEIDAALNPSVRASATERAPDWTSPVWNDVVSTARAFRPDPRGEWSLEVTGQGGPIPARFYPRREHRGHHAEREMVWFSADGKNVLRADPWGDYAMSWIYELHMHLLAGATGGLIVGWGGFAILALLFTGLASWWPRGSWAKAVAFKRNAVPLRRVRDLHKLSALWSLPVLVLLVFTGSLLALPDVKSALFAFVAAPLDAVPEPRSTRAAGTQIALTQALAAAHAAVPGATLAFIDVPGAGDAPFRMRVQVSGDPHRRFPGSFVFVDQYTGRVLAVHDVRHGATGTQVATWIRPIHDGSIAGVGTRVLAIVIGLAPAALFVTGLLYWQRRTERRRDRLHSNDHPTGTMQ